MSKKAKTSPVAEPAEETLTTAPPTTEETPAAEVNQFPAENVGGDDEHPTFETEPSPEQLAALGDEEPIKSLTSADIAESVRANFSTESVLRIPLGEIMPSPTNPRKFIDQAEIKALADNIRQQGLMQPIIVRPLRSVTLTFVGGGQGLCVPSSREKCAVKMAEWGVDSLDKERAAIEINDDCGYEIVAGERRYRAFCLINQDDPEAGAIDAIVRDLTDQQVLEQQVSENLQREDLTPLDWSHAYAAMVIAERQRTPMAGEAVSGERGAVQRVAERLGKSTSVIYQTMQLAKLIPEAATALRKEYITKNHAIDCARLTEEEQRDYLFEAFEIYDDDDLATLLSDGDDGPENVSSVRAMRKFIDTLHPEPEEAHEEQIPLAIDEDTIEEAAGMRQDTDFPGVMRVVRRTPHGTVIPEKPVFKTGDRVRDKEFGQVGTILEDGLGTGEYANTYNGYHRVHFDGQDNFSDLSHPFDVLEPPFSRPASAPQKSLQQVIDEADANRKAREEDQKLMRVGLKKILTASHSAAKRAKQLLTNYDLRRVAEAMFYMLSSEEQETIAELLRWEIKPYMAVITQYSQHLSKIDVALLPQFLITCSLAKDLASDSLSSRSNLWRSFESNYGVSLSEIRAELSMTQEERSLAIAKSARKVGEMLKKKIAADKQATPAKKTIAKVTAKKPALKSSAAAINKAARERWATKKVTPAKPVKAAPAKAAKPAAKAKKAGRK